MSLTESSRVTYRFYAEQRRARGLCHQCTRTVDEVNPRTGLPFWKCRPCRIVETTRKKLAYARRRKAA